MKIKSTKTIDKKVDEKNAKDGQMIDCLLDISSKTGIDIEKVLFEPIITHGLDYISVSKDSPKYNLCVFYFKNSETYQINFDDKTDKTELEIPEKKMLKLLNKLKEG